MGLSPHTVGHAMNLTVDETAREISLCGEGLTISTKTHYHCLISSK